MENNMQTLEENKLKLKEFLLQLNDKRDNEHFILYIYDDFYDTIEQIFNQEQEIRHKDEVLDEGDFILDFEEFGDSRKELVFGVAQIIMDVLKND